MFFFWISVALVAIGLLSFVSAALGIFARDTDKFYGILFNQLAMGFGGGIIAFFIFLKIDYHKWRAWAPFMFIGSIILTALVFIPGLGLEHGGAKRWITIGSFQFQPVEFLKIGFVFYFAAWLSWVRQRSRIPGSTHLGV